jgi:hypothetical protein
MLFLIQSVSVKKQYTRSQIISIRGTVNDINESIKKIGEFLCGLSLKIRKKYKNHLGSER